MVESGIFSLSSTQSCKILATKRLISLNFLAQSSATLRGCSIKGFQEYFLFCPVWAWRAKSHAFWIIAKCFKKYGYFDGMVCKNFSTTFASIIRVSQIKSYILYIYITKLKEKSGNLYIPVNRIWLSIGNKHSNPTKNKNNNQKKLKKHGYIKSYGQCPGGSF